MANQEVKVDATNFNRMCTKLADELGIDVKKVIRGEAETMLGRASQLTKASKKGTIEKRYKLKGKDSEWGKEKEWPFTWRYGPKQDKYFIPYVTIGSKKIKTRKIAKKDLPAVRDYLNKTMEEKKKRVGLAKSTFLTLGKQVKLTVKGSTAAKNAMDSTPSYNKTLSAKESGQGNSYELKFDINNHLAGAKHGGMEGALKIAMDGRVKYFKTNLAKDVFKNMESAYDKYGFMKG